MSILSLVFLDLTNFVILSLEQATQPFLHFLIPVCFLWFEPSASFATVTTPTVSPVVKADPKSDSKTVAPKNEGPLRSHNRYRLSRVKITHNNYRFRDYTSGADTFMSPFTSKPKSIDSWHSSSSSSLSSVPSTRARARAGGRQEEKAPNQ